MSQDQDRSQPHQSAESIEADKRREQFVRLLSQNDRRVYGYILSLVPNWQDADDIAQETNVRLWREFDRFEPGTNFTAWALRVAHFQVLTWRKQAARSRLVFSQELLDLIAEEHDRCDSALNTRHRALGACVEELSPRNHDLLAQCYAEGAKIKEIAQRLNRTTESIYKKLQRIRLALHKCIKRRGEFEGVT